MTEDDINKLTEAIDRKSVDQCMRDIQSTYDRFGDLNEDDVETFKSRLMTGLKVNVTPSINVHKNYVCVESDDMRLILENGVLTVNVI